MYELVPISTGTGCPIPVSLPVPEGKNRFCGRRASGRHACRSPHRRGQDSSRRLHHGDACRRDWHRPAPRQSLTRIPQQTHRRRSVRTWRSSSLGLSKQRLQRSEKNFSFLSPVWACNCASADEETPHGKNRSIVRDKKRISPAVPPHKVNNRSMRQRKFDEIKIGLFNNKIVRRPVFATRGECH
jgi:hypothetical protein